MALPIENTSYLLRFHIIQVDAGGPICSVSTMSGIFKLQCQFDILDDRGNRVCVWGSGFLLAFEASGRRRKGILTCYHVMRMNNEWAPQNQVKIMFEKAPNRSFILEQIADPLTPPIFDALYDFYYQEVNQEFEQDVLRLKIKFLERRIGNLCFEQFYLVHYPNGGEQKVSIGKIVQQTDISTNYLLFSQATTRSGSSGGALIESHGDDGFVFAMHLGTNVEGTIDHSTLLASIILKITSENVEPLGILGHCAYSAQTLQSMHPYC